MHKLITITTLALLVACGGAETPPDEPEDGTTAEAETDAASRAATIAVEVRAAPGEAEAILEKHGLSSAEFEALLYEVAADAELSAKYIAALE